MEHGRAEKRILEAASKRGQSLPEFISEAPELLPGLDIYLEAFRELNTCRPHIGMNGSAGPIPWTAIRDYAMDFGFDEEEKTYFEKIVRAVDDFYLEHMLAQNAAGQPAKGT